MDPGLDYEWSAGPAIDALINQGFVDFAAAMPVMGPVTLYLRAPFVWLVFHADLRVVYLVGLIPCLAVLAALVVWLRRSMTAAGRMPVAVTAVAILAVVNIAVIRALHWGHPEEIVGGVLLVAALICALRGRALAAGLLLGLALATKQWALLGIAPVLLAAATSDRRIRIALVAVAVAAVAYVPLYAAAPERTVDTTIGSGNPQKLTRSDSDDGLARVSPSNVWWPVAEKRTEQRRGETVHSAVVHHRIVSIAHALAVLLVFPLAWLYLRAGPRPREDAFALLALLMFLRCALDPFNLDYYHVPMVLAIVAWDALSKRTLPWATLWVTIGLGVAFLPYSDWFGGLYEHALYMNLTYLAWAIPFGLWLGAQVVRPATRVRPADSPARPPAPSRVARPSAPVAAPRR